MNNFKLWLAWLCVISCFNFFLCKTIHPGINRVEIISESIDGYKPFDATLENLKKVMAGTKMPAELVMCKKPKQGLKTKCKK